MAEINRSGSGRSGEGRGQGNRDSPEDSGPSWWKVGLGVAAGAAAVAGGLYALSQLEEEHPRQPKAPFRNVEPVARMSAARMPDARIPVARMPSARMPAARMPAARMPAARMPAARIPDAGMPAADNFNYAAQCIPPSARAGPAPGNNVSNLTALLEEIYTRYVNNEEEFAHRYQVFTKIFESLHQYMKEVNPYYSQYSSRLQFRRDEFNMYIIIGVPVNIDENDSNPEKSDIVIEPKDARFVQLRAGVEYRNILVRDDPDCLINRDACKWLDDENNYILRSKFIDWFKSVADKALTKFPSTDGYPCLKIDNILYKITTSCDGGAYTLWITNTRGFRLDVDLVPMLKFPETRWLGKFQSYRDIPLNCKASFWTVVPKPCKFGANSFDENRSWQVDMYDQEKKIIYNSFQMLPTNRLLKKLRAAQQMNRIDDYSIDTLFLLKFTELDEAFWQKDLGTIFKFMVDEFCKALVDEKIDYFWRENTNLLENVPENILEQYSSNLAKLKIELRDDRKYRNVAKYLLTDCESLEYECRMGRLKF